MAQNSVLFASTAAGSNPSGINRSCAVYRLKE
eukprot:CAMPEP_0118938176 /NCGR_PEP_ID=MMETSP1169-20130426/24998_1 /TAXON_ID=36882 /ORGANISM="Pyramimonas obovata, Strain CCMP722" /LENGTH=31 /DNA_ID= /DNA_START= /DNA_END= /DNA_ORIENTATION=